MAHHDKKQDNQHGKEHGHAHSPVRYFLVWAALLVFTITTVMTGKMDLGGANLPLALAIASVKAALVILFFMHLWDSEGVMKLVFSVAVVFVIVLLLGVFGDLLTRSPHLLPNAGYPMGDEPKPFHEPGVTVPPGPLPPPAH